MGCGSVSEGKVAMPAPLNNIYKRLELIGSGTFGKVYKCENQLNGLLYALKVVELTASTREEAIRQIDNLKRQIKVLKKLNHPNIVKYFSFDISPDNKQVEIVLEYAEKGSLKQYLNLHGPLSQHEVSEKTRQILEGLAYLHQQNIIHRDLKCANILVMEDGTLKITDFGTAKHLKEADQTSKQNISSHPSLKGTPYYMAPEILRRTGHTLSADIWSLGCLIIEMLSAKAPWISLTSDFNEIIGYIISGIHPPYPKGITQDCSSFLSSCFQSIATDRPSCSELLSHKWINKASGQSLSKYKRSLSKTNDDYEEVYEQRATSKAGIKALRQQKMRQIDNYMFSKAKTREKQQKSVKNKDKNRESAKPKRDRTANFICSSEQISAPEEEIDVFNLSRKDEPMPVARKLFQDYGIDQNKPQIKKTHKNVQTAPQVKLPQKLVSEIKELQQQDIQCGPEPSNIPKDVDPPIIGTRIKTEHSIRDDVIDTMISREERTRFLEQQRLLREQRQQEKKKWQRELQQGANYLRKEINSRYVA